jgi:hypothetical protein
MSVLHDLTTIRLDPSAIADSPLINTGDWFDLAVANESLGNTIWLATLLVLGVIVAFLVQRSRARTYRRCRAAVDRFAEMEQAKGPYLRMDLYAYYHSQGR